MAAIMTKRGSMDNVVTYEFMCDTAADMSQIEDRYKTLGTVCIVLEGSAGGMEIYIANSAGQWSAIGDIIGGGTSGETSGGTLSLHVCTQQEVTNGVPSISDPDENTIYFVATNGTGNDLYQEYVYVNDGWELIGGTSVDLSGYALTTDIPTLTSQLTNNSGFAYANSVMSNYNPSFSGSISGGRTGSSGQNSFAVGLNVEASGTQSHAEGSGTAASGSRSHAEGAGTVASGNSSHAEGNSTQATEMYAHSEGFSSTASGTASHAEGYYTQAKGPYSHAEGVYTISSNCNAPQHVVGSYNLSNAPTTIPTFTSEMANAAETWQPNKKYAMNSTILKYTENNTTTYYVPHNDVPEYVEPTKDSSAFWHQYSGSTGTSNAYFWNKTQTYAVNSIVKYTLNDGTVAYYQNHNAVTTTYIPLTTTAFYHTINIGDTNILLYPQQQYIEIVGNGNSNSRSNARSLDRWGNEYLMGELYVNCKPNGTNGTAVAKADSPVFTQSISMGRKANTTIGYYSVAVGNENEASGTFSHAEGYNNTATQHAAHAEGQNTTASYQTAHSEGQDTIASNAFTHAEGYGGTFVISNVSYTSGATNTAAHSEGYKTLASGSSGSHSEGCYTVSSGMSAHSEGNLTKALGFSAHVEGKDSIANGDVSHSEGNGCIATGDCSHAQGDHNQAYDNCSFAFGKYNIESTAGVEVVGNGTDETRSNARVLDWSGNEWLAGNLTASGGSITIGSTTITEQQLQGLLALLS